MELAQLLVVLPEFISTLQSESAETQGAGRLPQFSFFGGGGAGLFGLADVVQHPSPWPDSLETGVKVLLQDATGDWGIYERVRQMIQSLGAPSAEDASAASQVRKDPCATQPAELWESDMGPVPASGRVGMATVGSPPTCCS